jgi:uncharacterized protein (DUF1778 family)
MEVCIVKKAKRIMLYVTDEKYKQLKSLADTEKRSLNNYILILVDKALEEATK